MSTRAIRELLSGLYPDSKVARRVASDANLNEARIDFNGTPQVVWKSIVDEAIRAEKLHLLLEVAKDEYPEKVLSVLGPPSQMEVLWKDALSPVLAPFVVAVTTGASWGALSRTWHRHGTLLLASAIGLVLLMREYRRLRKELTVMSVVGVVLGRGAIAEGFAIGVVGFRSVVLLLGSIAVGTVASETSRLASRKFQDNAPATQSVRQGTHGRILDAARPIEADVSETDIVSDVAADGGDGSSDVETDIVMTDRGIRVDTGRWNDYQSESYVQDTPERLVRARLGGQEILARNSLRYSGESTRVLTTSFPVTQGRCYALYGSAQGSPTAVRVKERTLNVTPEVPIESRTHGDVSVRRFCAAFSGRFDLVVQADGQSWWFVAVVGQSVSGSASTRAAPHDGDVQQQGLVFSSTTYPVGEGEGLVANLVRGTVRTRPGLVGATPLTRRELRTNGSFELPIFLVTDRCVVAVGAVVPSVRRFSLSVLDPTGIRRMEETSSNDSSVASLNFCPAYSGRYRIRLHVIWGQGEVGVQVLR